MITLFDRIAMEHVPSLDLDPQLRDLLVRRIAALMTEDGDLRDHTEIVVVQSGDVEADIVRELGFSPLVSAQTGARFGEPGFEPDWDWVTEHRCCHGVIFHEAIFAFGSSFGYHLFVQDNDGVPADLLALLRGQRGTY